MREIIASAMDAALHAGRVGCGHDDAERFIAALSDAGYVVVEKSIGDALAQVCRMYDDPAYAPRDTRELNNIEWVRECRRAMLSAATPEGRSTGFTWPITRRRLRE